MCPGNKSFCPVLTGLFRGTLLRSEAAGGLLGTRETDRGNSALSSCPQCHLQSCADITRPTWWIFRIVINRSEIAKVHFGRWDHAMVFFYSSCFNLYIVSKVMFLKVLMLSVKWFVLSTLKVVLSAVLWSRMLHILLQLSFVWNLYGNLT